MANRHFAEIGDVWKHLALAEVLSLLDVHDYWESHSGSASYALEPSPARDYGALRFREHAGASPDLARSRYAALLAECSGRGRYPGSPRSALSCAPGAEFLFCDTDPASLETIRAEAGRLSLPPARVRTVLADGVETLGAALDTLPDERARNLLVFLDPYRPLEPGPSGVRSLDLFWRATTRGARVLLWYGFGNFAFRDDFLRAVRDAGDACRADAASCGLWRAEVTPEFVHAGIEDATGCHIGAGVLCANPGERAVATCRRLGHALAGVYADATLADGTPAALRFTESTPGMPITCSR